MLTLRPSCENCNKDLLPDAKDAMICSYECTFCQDCVKDILHNVCPNCGGNFTLRPIRPRKELLQNPASGSVIYKPVDVLKFQKRLAENKNLPPEER